MDQSPRTSFVIATRDRADDLTETLTRLLNTTPCPIIVVDNCSHDQTRDVTAELSGRYPSRVVLLALSSNRGAVARNIGVAACRTPYVAFCDDDSWWQPESVAIGESEFDQHPDLAVLAARTVVEPGGRTDPFCDELAGSALGHVDRLPGPSILGFQSCAAMVRKTAFESVGGFSRVLHFRGEEQLLAVDLAAAGWQLCYCDRMVAFHRPSPRRSAPAAQRARVLRNDFLTSCMRRPLPVCLATGAALLRAATRDTAYVRAAAEALARLPAALANRRALPPQLEEQLRMLETPTPRADVKSPISAGKWGILRLLGS
ncbi:glycosyltransferase family 2 protein [Mycobacterium noviomagense]|uniref:Transferase n=1 Tax=Mycobacterium noviomagense TaxID=459858 RepID=A0A7I7PH23_9MYCO|nr:glycosyltransferase family 2 protein [Mycobacterium noviomagense]ORB14133.1 transferase [Mycobacterium noviomagense]BBY07918.1 glycosyl transferase [Mycobacterium noviomagense]